MPNTIFDLLHTRVAAALSGMPEAPGGVYAELEQALEAGTTTAVVIEPGEDQTEPYGEATLRGRMSFSVHILTTGHPPSQLVGPIERAVHIRLMADPSLGGLCLRLFRTTGSRRIANAEQQHARRTITYQAEFLCNEADLSSAS